MSARYRFYLNNELVDDPTGWERFEENLRYDDSLHGYTTATDLNVVFGKSGYNLLRKLWHTWGTEFNVPLRIDESCGQNGIYKPVYYGLIFLADIEWDRGFCTAKTKVQDNSFYAMIYNNRNLEANITVGKSKNGVSITAPTLYSLDFFDLCTGDQLDARSGWRVYEVLQFLVEFMSDGKIGFVSELFNVGRWKNLYISNGWFLRLNGDDVLYPEAVPPKLSFAAFFNELWKCCFQSFIMEVDRYGKPYMRVEDDDWIRDTDASLTLDAVTDWKQVVDQNRLYASVRFGSTVTLDYAACGSTPSLPFRENIDFYGCKEEQFIIQSVSNVDKELDLVKNYVVSSNVIQAITVYDDPGFNDDVFLLHTNDARNMLLYQQEGRTDNYYYNDELLNYRIAERLFGNLPASIIQYLGTENDLFRAEDTEGDYSWNVIPDPDFDIYMVNMTFDDDFTLPNKDNNNHWGNGTTQGSPVNQMDSVFKAWKNGVFSFKTGINLPAIAGIVWFKIHIVRYDSGGVQISDDAFHTIFDPVFTLPLPETVSTLYLNKDETIRVRGYLYLALGSPTPDDVLPGSFVELIADNTINIKQSFDNGDLLAMNNIFKTVITNSQYDRIKGLITQKVKANSFGIPFNGWVKALKYSRHNGELTATLLNTIKSAQ